MKFQSSFLQPRKRVHPRPVTSHLENSQFSNFPISQFPNCPIFHPVRTVQAVRAVCAVPAIRASPAVLTIPAIQFPNFPVSQFPSFPVPQCPRSPVSCPERCYLVPNDNFQDMPVCEPTPAASFPSCGNGALYRIGRKKHKSHNVTSTKTRNETNCDSSTSKYFDIYPCRHA